MHPAVSAANRKYPTEQNKPLAYDDDDNKEKNEEKQQETEKLCQSEICG